MTRAQLKQYFYLWLRRAAIAVGATGGDIWLSARNPQGPIHLLLRPGRAGLGAGTGGASLAPRLHRLLLHQISLLARQPGRHLVDPDAIIQIQFILYYNCKRVVLLFSFVLFYIKNCTYRRLAQRLRISLLWLYRSQLAPAQKAMVATTKTKAKAGERLA